MQINPYLFFNDNCEAAFKFYEKVLGGKIEMRMRADEGPADMKPGPGREKLIMHARMSIDGQALNITCTSYSDALAFGLTGCRRTVPHLQRLLAYLDEELAALERAVGI